MIDSQKRILLLLLCAQFQHFMQMLQELFRYSFMALDNIVANNNIDLLPGSSDEPIMDFMQPTGTCGQHGDSGVTLDMEYPPVSSSRRPWTKTRTSEWWETTVLATFTDEDWLSNFRMTRKTFNGLCVLVAPYIMHEFASAKHIVPLDRRVALVLYKLSNTCENGVVANLFSVHKTTVRRHVRQFCFAMTKHVMPALVRFPNEAEAIEIAARFEEKYSVPQVMGCIDATHVPILPPKDNNANFANEENYASFVLQTVVDDRYRFRDVSCKVPGCASDTEVLMESSLYRAADKLPKAPCRIEGVDVPLQIIGDSAYPLLPWLLKGYDGNGSNAAERMFNACLSKATATIDTALVRLKARWRILQKKIDVHFTFAPYVICTCCVLHNYLELHEEVFMLSWLDEQLDTYAQPCISTNSDITGSCESRRALTVHIHKNLVTSHQQRASLAQISEDSNLHSKLRLQSA